MNNKDKSFFVKLILATVIFVSFITVLGLTVCLMKNKKVVNREPQISASPKPTVSVKDETKDWQTYRNEEYGFEVKYPKDWVASDHSSGLLVLKNTQEKMSGTKSFFVTDSFFTIKIKKNHEISGVAMEKISIGGRLSYKYFYQEGAGTSEVILIQLGKDALELSLDYFASNGGNFNDTKIAIQGIINPILSTFKFNDSQD